MSAFDPFQTSAALSSVRPSDLHEVFPDYNPTGKMTARCRKPFSVGHVGILSGHQMRKYKRLDARCCGDLPGLLGGCVMGDDTSSEGFPIWIIGRF